MNNIQFFISQIIPFRIKKKVIEKKEELSQEDRAFLKEQHEEQRRLMLIKLDREAKRFINGHGF
jgi:hypothetical protein